MPELILSGTAIILLIASLFTKKGTFVSWFSIFGILTSLYFVVAAWNVGTPPLFHGLLILDKPAMFFKLIFAVTALFVIIFSQRSNELTSDHPEYYSLIVGSVLGMNLLAEANNLLSIYLALEFVSLVSFILVGFVKGSVRSSEASLKYVLYGAVASGIFLYGASLYYGSTGSLQIASFKFQNVNQLAGVFMLAGFLYKIAAVPMHAWCPDAYEGAPTPITAFLSVAPKAAGFAVLMRVGAEIGLKFNWPVLIAIISAITMTLGNLVAIPQTNVKRLLAYSSIAHAGYLLMGLACNTQRGNEAVYFYFIAYLLMNLGAFVVVQIVANKFNSETIDVYKGLGKKGPYGAVLGIVMTVFLLSLTGVPPFIGFIGKFYIFSAVISAKLYWLAIVGIINSVISLYYYMRIVKVMFFDAPTEEVFIPAESKRLAASAIALSIATVVLGLMWQPISQFTSSLIN